MKLTPQSWHAFKKKMENLMDERIMIIQISWHCLQLRKQCQKGRDLALLLYVTTLVEQYHGPALLFPLYLTHPDSTLLLSLIASTPPFLYPLSIVLCNLLNSFSFGELFHLFITRPFAITQKTCWISWTSPVSFT